MKKLTLPAVLLLAVACAPPERDYDLSEIEAVTDLETLMWVQATVADPRFDLVEDLDEEPLNAAQSAEFDDLGVRLKACANKLRGFSEGREGFKKFADRQTSLAEQLLGAVADGASGPVAESVVAIQENCAACHREYR